MVAQSEAFQKAVVDSKKLISKPTNDDLLEIYGLYKIGTGEDIEQEGKPTMFDIRKKYKYNAWQKAVEKGLTPEQAQENYVAEIEKMKEKYGYDENKEPEAVGGN